MSIADQHIREDSGEGNVTATQSVLPAPHLRPYIRAYRFFDLDASRPYTVPAWTRSVLLFMYGDGSCNFYCDGQRRTAAGVFFLGPSSSPVAYGNAEGRLCFAAVEFRSLVMSAIVRRDLTGFSNEFINAADILDANQLDVVVETLSEAGELSARWRILDGFLTDVLSGIDVSMDPSIREALTAIHAHRGPVSTEHLAELTGMAERSIRRRFAAVTGLAPTRYSRVLRGERAIGCLFYRPELSAADLVRSLGFSDHSHLVHELRNLARATPGQLRRQAMDGVAPLRDFFRLDAL